MSYDRFGNLVDDEGHDILDDGEEWEPEFDDDFPFELEYPEDFYYEESYMTGDSDLGNEY